MGGRRGTRIGPKEVDLGPQPDERELRNEHNAVASTATARPSVSGWLTAGGEGNELGARSLRTLERPNKEYPLAGCPNRRARSTIAE